MCSRTKSGPWKLYGEAVSLSSLQLKRDSKTSSLTPEIWAFPPAHLPLHAPVPVRPFQGENIPESFPQNERPDHSPFFFIFPILTGLGRKLKLRTDLWAFTLFPPWLGLAGGSDGKDSVCNLGDRGVQPLGWADPGGENGNPLQYFCLENPMDRGAWRATVHGVTKSRTRPNTGHFHFSTVQWDIIVESSKRWPCTSPSP